MIINFCSSSFLVYLSDSYTILSYTLLFFLLTWVSLLLDLFRPLYVSLFFFCFSCLFYLFNCFTNLYVSSLIHIFSIFSYSLLSSPVVFPFFQCIINRIRIYIQQLVIVCETSVIQIIYNTHIFLAVFSLFLFYFFPLWPLLLYSVSAVKCFLFLSYPRSYLSVSLLSFLSLPAFLSLLSFFNHFFLICFFPNLIINLLL